MMARYEEEDEQHEKLDADLTLGIGSLLSIFFGVVLVCGIFFGFGYSMGRRNTQSTATDRTHATTPAPLSDEAAMAAKTQPPDSSAAFPADFSTPDPDESKLAAKPANQPVAAPSDNPRSNATSPDTDTSAKAPRVATPNAPETSLAAVPFTHRAPLPAKPHAGIPAAPAPPAAEPDATTAPGHPIMVQIAAVSRQEDAEVLAGALRKRGFSPQIRNGQADKFFHVQVGPFTDKAEAETMKQHLLADGYNAIVK